MSKNYQKGISLVESLVTLLFLSLALTPLFSVVLSSDNLSNSVRNNLTATNLAEEGLELVRSIRDTNWFNDLAFDTGLSDGNYRIQWNSTALLAHDSSSYLMIGPTGIYGYDSGGTQSQFKRRVNITKIVSTCNCELKILSEITWTERGRIKNVTIESHLFDWR